MKHHDHYHCPVCGAEYASQSELQQHEKRRHTQQGLSGAVPSNEYPVAEDERSQLEADTKQRKNREFTRRHME